MKNFPFKLKAKLKSKKVEDIPITIVFISFVFCFLITLCIVCYFYLKRSARCNVRNVVLQVFLLKIILRLLMYLVKFNLPLIVPEELMNFKLNILAFPEAGRGNCLPNVQYSASVAFLRVRRINIEIK